MSMACNYGGEGIVKALNAHVYGNGTQALVLAHGFGSDQTVWHYLIPYFACFFKVVVFDLAFSANVDPKFYDFNKYLNFNGYAQDLVCLLDHLQVNNTVYVGHSMSAMIGCLAATKRPQLFQHLVLLGGSPRYLNAKGYYGGFERWELNEIFEQMDQNFPRWVENFVPTAIGVNSTSATQELEYSLVRMKPKIALSVAKTVFLSDLRPVLQRVTLPSTIIQSEKDPVVPISVASYMKTKLGGSGGGHAKVKILKTQGHFPQLTVYPLLLKVLKRVLHIN